MRDNGATTKTNLWSSEEKPQTNLHYASFLCKNSFFSAFATPEWPQSGQENSAKPCCIGRAGAQGLAHAGFRLQTSARSLQQQFQIPYLTHIGLHQGQAQSGQTPSLPVQSPFEQRHPFLAPQKAEKIK